MQWKSERNLRPGARSENGRGNPAAEGNPLRLQTDLLPGSTCNGFDASKREAAFNLKVEGCDRSIRSPFFNLAAAAAIATTIVAAATAATAAAAATATVAASAAYPDDEQENDPGATIVTTAKETIATHYLFPPFDLQYIILQPNKSCYKNSSVG